MTVHSDTALSRESPVFLRLIAIWFCGFCPFLAVYATQPLLPTLARYFNASENDASLTITATTVAVAIIAPFIGLVADGIGRKLVIVAAIFFLAVPMALAAMSNSLQQLVLWRFLQGLFIPGIFSIALAYIGEEWEAKDRGLATSAYVSGNVFGSVSGRVVSGLVATYANWRMSFVVLSALLLVGGVGVWILLPRSKNFVPQGNMRIGLQAMAAHFKNRELLTVCLVGFNTLFVFVGTFTFITFYLSHMPFLLRSGALGLMFLVNLFGAVATPFAGRWIDKVGAQKVLLAALCASMVGILLTLTHVISMIFVGLALVSMGVFVANSAASSQLARVTGKARSSAAGLYVCFYYIGGSLGAVIPGLAFAWGGWAACTALLISVMLISGAASMNYWSRVAAKLS